MSILIFIIILAILVLVHEFGHFIAAKRQGVKVEEFGFGFPPRLFGWKIGETIYSINLIPLGGFVKLFGEEYHEIKKKSKISSRAFVNKKPWQKALIVIAGVVGNFLLGWVLISFLFTQGVPVPTNKVIVEGVSSSSPAHDAGLKKGDVVKQIAINDKQYKLSSATDLINLSKKFSGQELIITVLRENKELSLNIIPRINPPAGEGPLGVTITSFAEKKFPWYSAPLLGLIESFNITKNIVLELSKIFVQLLTFQKPTAQIAGPIGIVQFTSQAIKFGKNAVLELVALLSFNLAIINILPFPALDGGRLVFVLYEWISKKPSPKTIEKYANLVGFIILVTIALLISVNDIIRMYR